MCICLLYILLEGDIKKITMITYQTFLDILGMGTGRIGKKRRGRDIFTVSLLYALVLNHAKYYIFLKLNNRFKSIKLL